MKKFKYILFFTILLSTMIIGQVKISELPTLNSPDSTDYTIMVSGGITKKIALHVLVNSAVAQTMIFDYNTSDLARTKTLINDSLILERAARSAADLLKISIADSAIYFYKRAYIDAVANGKLSIADSATYFYKRAYLDAALAAKQASLTFGIANTNKVQINAADVAEDDYAKFTATGLLGRSYAEVLSDIGAAALAQTMYIGTTAHAINRASAAEGLMGITSLTPGADFTLSQNSVNVFTSENSGAIVNTLYLKACNVGISTVLPSAKLDVAGSLEFETVQSPIRSLTSLNIAWDSASIFRDTIAVNSEYTFSSEADAQWITVEIFSNGSYTATFSDAAIVWQGGVAPTQTADKTDIYQFFRSGSRIFGMVMQNF